MEHDKTSRCPKDFESLPAEENIDDSDSSPERNVDNPASSDVGRSADGSRSLIEKVKDGSDSSGIHVSTVGSDSSGVRLSTAGSDSSTERTLDKPDDLDQGKSPGDSLSPIGGSADAPDLTDAGTSPDGTGLSFSPDQRLPRAAAMRAVQLMVRYAIESAAEEATRVASQAAQDGAQTMNDQRTGAASELPNPASGHLNADNVSAATPEEKEETAEAGSAGSGYSQADMRRLQSMFAEQAFNFLLRNYQVFNYFPAFARDLPETSNYSVCFTYEVGEALVLVSYVNRVGYRRAFRRYSVHDIRDFRGIVASRRIAKDDGYFYNFLNWVAFTLELAVHCLKLGHDFIETGKLCVANYEDLDFFHSQGGWGRFIEYCHHMAGLYDRISLVASQERPTDAALIPFMRRVEDILRGCYRLRQKDYLSQPEVRTVRQIRQNLLDKYEVLDRMGKNEVTAGFLVRRREKPIRRRKLAEIFPSGGFEPSEESKLRDHQLSSVSTTLAQTRILDEMGVDESAKSSITAEFLVSARFLVNWERNKKKRSQRRRLRTPSLIHLLSPTKRAASSAAALGERLEQGLESQDYLDVGNNLFLVAPAGGREAEDDGKTVTVVLDTDSEDDDGEDDDGKGFEATGLDLNELIQRFVLEKTLALTERLVGACRLRPDLPGLARDAPFAPTRDTGAIPKQPRQRKPSRKKAAAVASPEKAGKDSSDSGNVAGGSGKGNETGAIPKQPRQRKPSKKKVAVASPEKAGEGSDSGNVAAGSSKGNEKSPRRRKKK